MKNSNKKKYSNVEKLLNYFGYEKEKQDNKQNQLEVEKQLLNKIHQTPPLVSGEVLEFNIEEVLYPKIYVGYSLERTASEMKTLAMSANTQKYSVGSCIIKNNNPSKNTISEDELTNIIRNIESKSNIEVPIVITSLIFLTA